MANSIVFYSWLFYASYASLSGSQKKIVTFVIAAIKEAPL